MAEPELEDAALSLSLTLTVQNQQLIIEGFRETIVDKIVPSEILPCLVATVSTLKGENGIYKSTRRVTKFHLKLGHVVYVSTTDTSQNGNKSKTATTKTATTKTATNPKRRQTKTATRQNGDKPKRRQPKRRHIQNGDMPKRRHIQNGDNQDGDNQNGACMSPFWRVAVLDTTKTATNPKRRQSNLSKTPC